MGFEQAVQAIQRADGAALAVLLDATPDLLAARDADGRTLLFLACDEATGHVAIPPVVGTPAQHAIVDELLRRGADPSAASRDGWSPLHAAAMAGHVDLARCLLAAGLGANVSPAGAAGRGALLVGEERSMPVDGSPGRAWRRRERQRDPARVGRI